MKFKQKKFIGIASLAMVAAFSAGLATVSANADEGALDGFEITATSVRTVDPSGLRFRIELPESVEKEDVTNAYTIISLTPASGEQASQSVSENVPATVWRPATDGNGWNTVLLGIPETDYTTVVTAQAFATINGVEYQTETVSSSIAKTASLVMNKNNAIDATLNDYVKDIENITLDKATAEITNNETVTLTATVTSESSTAYGVVWQSSNEDVVTVDKNGVVAGVGEGTAEITATMGGVTSAACVVTAKQTFDGTFESWTTDRLANSVNVAYGQTGKYAMSIVEDPVGENGKVIKFERKYAHSSAPVFNLKLTADILENVKAGSVLTMQVYGERPQGSDTIALVVTAPAAATDKNGIEFGRPTLVSGSATASAGWTTIEFTLTEAQAANILASGCIQFQLNGNSTSESVYYIDDLTMEKATFDGTFESWTTDRLISSVNVAYHHGGKYAMSIVEDPVGENGKVIKFERKYGHSSAPVFNLKLTADVLENVKVGSVLSMEVYGERPQGSDSIALVVAAPSVATASNSSEIGRQTLAVGSGEWTTIEFTLTEAQVANILASGCIQFQLNGNSTSESVYYIDDLKIEKATFDGTFESWTTDKLVSSVNVAYHYGGKYAMSIVEDPVGENGKVIKFERKLGHSSATTLNLKLTADILENVKVGSVLSMEVYGERPQGSDTIALVVVAPDTATGKTGSEIGRQTLAVGSGEWTTIEFTLTEAQVANILASGCIQFQLNGNSTSESVYYINDLMIK